MPEQPQEQANRLEAQRIAREILAQRINLDESMFFYKLACKVAYRDADPKSTDELPMPGIVPMEDFINLLSMIGVSGKGHAYFDEIVSELLSETGPGTMKSQQHKDAATFAWLYDALKKLADGEQPDEDERNALADAPKALGRIAIRIKQEHIGEMSGLNAPQTLEDHARYAALARARCDAFKAGVIDQECWKVPEEWLAAVDPTGEKYAPNDEDYKVAAATIAGTIEVARQRATANTDERGVGIVENLQTSILSINQILRISGVRR